MISLKKNFTTGDIAYLLSVTPRTVAIMVDRNQIVGFRLPAGDRRIPRENLVRFLKSIGHETALREIGE